MSEQIISMLKEQSDMIEGFVEKVENELNSLKKRIEFIERANSPRAVSLPGVELEKEKFSFVRAINAIRTNDWSGAGFEKEVFDNTRKKSMGTGTGSAGGYIVPTQYIAELIEMLREESVVIALGATVLDNLTGSPVEIPKQAGGATAYWVGENADITASSLTFGQLSFTPKSVAALVKFSNRLLTLSNPSIETIVRRDIAQTLALAIDLACLRGSGTAGQPRGIANTSGINTVSIGANGGPFTFDIAQDMVTELEIDNALKGKLGFVMHPLITKKLKKYKVPQFSGDTGGMPVVLPMTDQNLRDLLGYDFKTTTQIPTNLTKGTGSNLSEVYFGNWQELIIAMWGGLEITASNETSDAFQKNQTWVRAIQDVDVGLRHPESFCLCSDATTL
jgi:HK97 family phage major capsid protein